MTARTAKHRTVIEHVLSRLHAIGISEVFGVPGDYAFPVQDAIVNFLGIAWVGCCNELNAAYAADGYARIRGIGASWARRVWRRTRLGPSPALM
jgi:indolepyruvate decarboxylase